MSPPRPVLISPALSDMLAAIGSDEMGFIMLLVVVTSFATSITLFYLLDKGGVLPKLQPKHAQITPRESQIALSMTLTILALFLPGLIYSGPLLRLFLLPLDSAFDPSAPELVGKLLMFLLIDDTWFYMYHRALHTIPYLYLHIHKPHHFFTAPFALVAICQHPVEMALQSFGGNLGPFLLFTTHPFEYWLYLAVRIYLGVEDHAGTQVPWSLSRLLPAVFGGPEFHDEHHLQFSGNYASVFAFLDRCGGTAL